MCAMCQLPTIFSITPQIDKDWTITESLVAKRDAGTLFGMQLEICLNLNNNVCTQPLPLRLQKYPKPHIYHTESTFIPEIPAVGK